MVCTNKPRSFFWSARERKTGQVYPYYAKAYISAGDGLNFQTLTIDIESRKLYKKELDSMLKQDGIRARFRYTGPFPKSE